MTDILAAVSEEFDVELKSRHQAGPLRRLLDDGMLEKYPVLEGVDGKWQNGAAYTYRVPDLDDVSLRAVWEVAALHIVPKEELALEPGRKSTAIGHDSRRVLAVHEGQMRAIRAAATKTVEHMIPSSRRRPDDTNDEAWARILDGMSQIDAPHLVWAEGGGAHGAGDWAILGEVENATRSLTPSSRHKYVGAIRTLLDLGASHGFLLQKDVHGAPRSYLPTAWAQTLKKWGRIVRESPHSRRVQGTAHMSRIMAALADFFRDKLDSVDPMRLTGEQSTAFGKYYSARLSADQTITSHHRSCTLAALRALMDAGVMSAYPITAFDRRRITGRKSAFDTPSFTAIAREFCCDSRKLDADYGLFAALGTGAFLDPGNPYSLPQLIDWYTLQAARHRRARKFGKINGFPRESVRGTGGLSGRPWTAPTIEFHLELLGIYLGWVSKYKGIDLDGDADARTLFSIDLLDEFLDAVDQDCWTTPNRALNVIVHTSLYCSPCWEAVALAEGDEEAADHFQRVSDYANGRGGMVEPGRYDGLTAYESQAQEWDLGSGNRASIARSKAQARAVQRAYEMASGLPYAYLAMLGIRNAAIKRFCRDRGIANLKVLRREIERGETMLSNGEFCLIRDITVLGLGLAAPHRRATVSALDRSDFYETSEGVLWTKVAGNKFKVSKNGVFELKLAHRAAEVGDMGFRWDLWDCYDVCRSARLETSDSDALILTSVPGKSTRKTRDPLRLEPDSISVLYTRVIEYGAHELGWDISPIRELAAGSTGHALRHAVGSYFVARDMHELARRMLHHRGLDTLLQVYGAGKTDLSAEDAMQGVKV